MSTVKRNYVRTRVVNAQFTKAEWDFKDPILNKGEIGFETDTNRAKVGNGVHRWTELNYLGTNSTSLDETDFQNYYNKNETDELINDTITMRSQNKVESLSGINLGHLIDGNGSFQETFADFNIVNEDLVLRVNHVGSVRSLRIYHSYDKHNGNNELPWFTLYPYQDTWGDFESRTQQNNQGVKANYIFEDGVGTWKLVIEKDGNVYNTIKNIGRELVFFLDLRDRDNVSIQEEELQQNFP